MLPRAGRELALLALRDRCAELDRALEEALWGERPRPFQVSERPRGASVAPGRAPLALFSIRLSLRLLATCHPSAEGPREAAGRAEGSRD